MQTEPVPITVTEAEPPVATQAIRPPRRKIVFLEAVRGIAASLVVVQHVLAGVDPGYSRLFGPTGFIDLGRVGVVAFFLVSGYIIPISLQHHSQRVFWTRRLFRLYPAYLIALAAYVLANPLARTDLHDPLPLILNGLMIQGVVGVASILPIAWTLGIELLFYAEAALCKSAGRLPLLGASVWGWLVVYFGLCVAERLTRLDLPVAVPLLLAVAAIGYRIAQADAGVAVTWRATTIVAAVVVCVGALIAQGLGGWDPVPYSLSALAGGTLFLALRRLPAALTPGWLLRLGAISYSTYLVHPIVFHLVIGIPDLQPFTVAAICFVVVPLVAALMYRVIEQPSNALGRRLSTPRRQAHLAGGQ